MSAKTIKNIKLLRGVIAVLVVFILVLLIKPFYVLNEGQTVIITQFGEIIKTETEAGLHFKMPILHRRRSAKNPHQRKAVYRGEYDEPLAYFRYP